MLYKYILYKYMITSEIIINRLTLDANGNSILEFNENKLENTIDDIFKNIGDDKNNKKTYWYYIKWFLCCKNKI